MSKRLFFNSDNLLERPKSCVLIRLFVKKHVSLPLIASDGVVCLAKKHSLKDNLLKAKWGITIQRGGVLSTQPIDSRKDRFIHWAIRIP